jgi:hypothetical protein
MEFYECVSLNTDSSGEAAIKLENSQYDGVYKLVNPTATGADRVFSCEAGEIRYAARNC